MKSMRTCKNSFHLWLSKQQKLYLKTSSDWVPIKFCKASFLVFVSKGKNIAALDISYPQNTIKICNISSFTGSHMPSAVTYICNLHPNSLKHHCPLCLPLVLYHCKVTCTCQSKNKSMLTSIRKQIFPCKSWGKQTEKDVVWRKYDWIKSFVASFI